MANILCRDPQLCKVKSHLPGTQAECMKQRASGRYLQGANGAPVSLTTPVSTSTNSAESLKLKNRYESRYLTTSPMQLAREMRIGARQEKVIKLTKDKTIRHIASKYGDLISDPHKQLDIESKLMRMGFGGKDTEQGRVEATLAFDAVQDLHNSRNDVERGILHYKRLSALSTDPYVREHSDSIYMGNEEGDVEGMEEAKGRLRERLVEIGVPDDEVDSLIPQVSKKVHDQFEDNMEFEKRKFNNAETPYWEPYRVNEALARADKESTRSTS